MSNRLTKQSKFLALILRHDPSVIKIQLDPEGWANVDELIFNWNRTSGATRITRTILDEIVSSDSKKRYAYSEDGLKIRASQGHSIDIDLKLEEKKPPEFLYHGTIDTFLPSIMVKGLMKMERNHVHLSPDVETAIKVGQRRAKNGAYVVVLRVASGVMSLLDWYKFFLSANGVWLIDSVQPAYLEVLPKEKWPIDEKLWNQVSKQTAELMKGYNDKPDY